MAQKAIPLEKSQTQRTSQTLRSEVLAPICRRRIRSMRRDKRIQAKCADGREE